MRNRKRKRKRKNIFSSPPRLGRFWPKSRLRPLPAPLLPRPKQPSNARAAPCLTARPHRSAAPPLSLSRCSPAGSTGPLVRSLVPLMPSPACSPPTTATLSPRINARTGLSYLPATVPEPSPHPSATRAIPSPFAPSPPSW
jgi:hypothetical protein